jgi:hypothetical protein
MDLNAIRIFVLSLRFLRIANGKRSCLAPVSTNLGMPVFPSSFIA